MTENIGNGPVKSEQAPSTGLQAWRPLEGLRREVDRVFDEFGKGFWGSSWRRSFFDIEPSRQSGFGALPAVDIIETDKGYEITAELPGMEEKNIEVKSANGVLTIKGEKKDEKEEKKKDYYVQERSFGAFARTFRLPDGVDADKIEASFNNGVLTVMLPKSAEAQKAEKKIAVKAG